MYSVKGRQKYFQYSVEGIRPWQTSFRVAKLQLGVGPVNPTRKPHLIIVQDDKDTIIGAVSERKIGKRAYTENSGRANGSWRDRNSEKCWTEKTIIEHCTELYYGLMRIIAGRNTEQSFTVISRTFAMLEVACSVHLLYWTA